MPGRLEVGLPLVDLRLRGVDLLLDLRGLRSLRRDHEVVREEPDDEQRDDHATDLEPLVQGHQLLLHDVAPAGRTAPCSVNVTMPFGHSPVETEPLSPPAWDFPRVMPERSGTTPSRARKRATESWEYVQPVIVKVCVTVPGTAAAAAAAPRDGACAFRLSSQTSLGTTWETSRSSLSHATRCPSAEASAVTRVVRSAGSSVCAAGGAAGTGSAL